MTDRQTTIPEDLNVFFINSATVPGKLYKVCEKNSIWYCSGADGNPSGACKHFQMQGIEGSPCRHILEAQLKSLYVSFKTGQELFEAVCRETAEARDIRDAECMDFEDVISLVQTFKGEQMNVLSNLMLRIAVVRGRVTTDMLHDATKERYQGQKIIGVVAGHLLRSNLLKVIDREPTKRKIAHGRSIYVFAITDHGIDYLTNQTKNRRLI